MEGIGQPQVILLEDQVRDGERVNRILDHLIALNAVHVVTIESLALDFFSAYEHPPWAIILFMNSKKALGLYRGANYRLLHLKKHGVARLRGAIGPTIVNSAGRSYDLLGFFSGFEHCEYGESTFHN
jgi:hypothetical protein